MSALAAMSEERTARGRSLVEGEFVFTAEDFRAIAAMLHGDAGIALHPEAKATLVYSAPGQAICARLGLESFRDYCALVSGHRGRGRGASAC